MNKKRVNSWKENKIFKPQIANCLPTPEKKKGRGRRLTSMEMEKHYRVLCLFFEGKKASEISKELDSRSIASLPFEIFVHKGNQIWNALIKDKYIDDDIIILPKFDGNKKSFMRNFDKKKKIDQKTKGLVFKSLIEAQKKKLSITKERANQIWRGGFMNEEFLDFYFVITPVDYPNFRKLGLKAQREQLKNIYLFGKNMPKPPLMYWFCGEASMRLYENEFKPKIIRALKKKANEYAKISKIETEDDYLQEAEKGIFEITTETVKKLPNGLQPGFLVRRGKDRMLNLFRKEMIRREHECKLVDPA